MRTLDQFTEEQLQDPEFAKEYAAIQPELDEIRATVDAKASKNLAP